MKKHLQIAALGAAAVPVPAFASGFYLPWWGEALAFLLLTPAGWVCGGLVVVALIVAAVRWKGLA